MNGLFSVNQHFTDIYTTPPTASTNSDGFRCGRPGGGFPGGGNGGFPGRGGGGFPGGLFNGAINYPPAIPYLFGTIVYLYNHLLEPFFHRLFARRKPIPFTGSGGAAPLSLTGLVWVQKK